MERLTQEDLEAIRKRAEKATEGPWYYNEKWSYLAPTVPQKSVCAITNDITRSEDADFIASAREDVPKLLAEVARLQTFIAGKPQNCVDCGDYFTADFDRKDGLYYCERCDGE